MPIPIHYRETEEAGLQSATIAVKSEWAAIHPNEQTNTISSRKERLSLRRELRSDSIIEIENCEERCQWQTQMKL